MATVERLVNIDQGMLKRLARMYENGVSIKEISDELNMSIRTTMRILKLMGYTVE